MSDFVYHLGSAHSFAAYPSLRPQPPLLPPLWSASLQDQRRERVRYTAPRRPSCVWINTTRRQRCPHTGQ